MPKTFSIDTLGCKINQYESQQIRELLERLGLDQVETSEKPDLAVINTCCVTHTASAKSRQHIRKAQKFSPDAVVVVAGCLPTVQTGELTKPGKNVHLISYRNDLAATLARLANGKAAALDPTGPETPQISGIETINISKLISNNDLAIQPQLPQLSCFKGHTRAFLKVQDGCDGHCSYCIIPKARPFVRSKPPEAVLREARALVEAGHREIVVTGVNLGAYGQSTVRRKTWERPQNDRLAELLDRVAEIPDLARIRLSSLEPADVTPRLIDVHRKHRNIMPHLHLSLQSGSNTVLRRMGRQYTADEFKQTVELIRSRLDRPAITTDIIVGFPGENEADFEQTVDLAEDVGFAKMHVFRFSPRDGTAAANMQDTVDAKVTKKRAEILRASDRELGHEFRQQFIGETATVLVENSDTQPCGRSERYFKVCVKGAQKLPKKNDLVEVRLIENSKDGAIGEALH